MSSTLKIINGRIITLHRVINNATLFISDGIITEISEKKISSQADNTIDANGNYISPGFIDMHIHGGGGSDFMDGTVKDFLTIAETHLQYGTTSMTPTTMTSEKEELLHTLETYKKANAENIAGSQFQGMHLEGPYFALNQKGAQDPKYIRCPDEKEYKEVIQKAGGIISRWSGAPELENGLKFGRYLVAHDILPAIAHTDAIYDDVVNAFENGYTLATHFYSGMSGVTRRNAFRYAGVIESVYLMDEMDVEIIADGVHLPAPLLKLIFKIKGVDRIALITDAMRAAGMGPGKSILGSNKNGLNVIVEDGVAKLPDRTSFAGSVATTDRLIRTMINMAGVSLVDAIRMMTYTPARILNLHQSKGSIAVGKDADILIFDDAINMQSVIVGGRVLINHL